jgi:hypothetical protein
MSGCRWKIFASSATVMREAVVKVVLVLCYPVV